MNEPINQKYEFNLRILGNEILSIGVVSTSSSNKWIAITLVAIFCFMTLLGAYGEKFISLYHALVN